MEREQLVSRFHRSIDCWSPKVLPQPSRARHAATTRYSRRSSDAGFLRRIAGLRERSGDSVPGQYIDAVLSHRHSDQSANELQTDAHDPPDFWSDHKNQFQQVKAWIAGNGLKLKMDKAEKKWPKQEIFGFARGVLRPGRSYRADGRE